MVKILGVHSYRGISGKVLTVTNRQMFMLLALLACGVLTAVMSWRLMDSERTLWGRRRIHERLVSLRTRAATNPADEHAIAGLIESLKAGGSFERTHAAIELGKLGPQGATAVDALIKAAKGEDRYVSREAAKALGRIGPEAEAAVPTLISFVRDHPLSDTGWFAAESLGKIAHPNDPTVWMVLEEASKSAHQSMADSARYGLESLRKRGGAQPG
jgi:hypothetical protein